MYVLNKIQITGVAREFPQVSRGPCYHRRRVGNLSAGKSLLLSSLSMGLLSIAVYLRCKYAQLRAGVINVGTALGNKHFELRL